MLIRSFTYSLLTKLSVGFISLLILIISSRYLGVVSRGEISIFLLNLTLMQILNEVYTGYSIIHFIPKYNWRKLITGGIIYTVLNTALCNALVTGFQRQVPGYELLGYGLSLLVMLNTFNCVLLLGKQNIRAYNLLSILQPLLLVVGIVYCVFVQHDFRFSAFVYPMFFSFLVAWVVSTLLVFITEPPLTNPAEFRLSAVLAHGLMYQIGAGMLIFCNRLSYYLLADNKSVGLYASASALAESVLIISNGISTVLLARLANNNLKQSPVLIVSLAKAAALLSLVILGLLCAIPETIWLVLLGQGFKGISSLLLVYSPAVSMLVFASVIANYFVAKGLQKPASIAYGAGFMVSVVAAPLLIKFYGTTGAAFNALLAYACIAIAITLSFMKRHGIPFADVFQLDKDYKLLKDLFAARFKTYASKSNS